MDTAALYKGWKLGMPRQPGENSEMYARRVLGIRAPGLKYSVPTCLQTLGIQIEPSHLHDADNDAYATHLIFEALQKILAAGSEAVPSGVRTSMQSAGAEARSTLPTPVDGVLTRKSEGSELK
jgi:DNA polymerase III epsilon subunit-like protein